MSTSEHPDEYDLGLDEMLTEWHQKAEVSGSTSDAAMPGEIKGAEEGVLTASGLTACVGIAVYDETNETGYMGHIVTQGVDDFPYEVQKFSSVMISEGVDFDNSRIHFAGLDYDNEVSDNFLGDQRELSETAQEGAYRRILEKYGESRFDEVETSWGYEGENGGRLIMDANKGEINYDPVVGLVDNLINYDPQTPMEHVSESHYSD